MKNPLGKTELTGIALLALLIAVITGCGLLLRRCGYGLPGSEAAQEQAMRIIATDTVTLPVETSRAGVSDRKGKKPGKEETKSRRKRPAANKARKKAGKAASGRKDPFSDTVPTTY